MLVPPLQTIHVVMKCKNNSAKISLKMESSEMLARHDYSSNHTSIDSISSQSTDSQLVRVENMGPYNDCILSTWGTQAIATLRPASRGVNYQIYTRNIKGEYILLQFHVECHGAANTLCCIIIMLPLLQNKF